MRALRRFLVRLTASATRRRDEERLREEVEEHLALQTAENMRAGLSPVEARRQARAQVRRGRSGQGTLSGGAGPAVPRESLPGRAVRAAAVAQGAVVRGHGDAVACDGHRRQRRHLHARRSRAAAERSPSPIRRSWSSSRINGVAREPSPRFSYPFYAALRDNTVLMGVAARFLLPLNTTINGGAARVSGELVSGNYFSVVGAGTRIGRPLDAGGRPNARGARRGGDQRWLLAADLRIRSCPCSDVTFESTTTRSPSSVSPPRGFTGTEVGLPTDIWLPMMMQREVGRDLLTDARTNWLEMIGRLKPGASLERAGAELTAYSKRRTRAGHLTRRTEPAAHSSAWRQGQLPCPSRARPGAQSAAGAHGACAGAGLRQCGEPARRAIRCAREGDRRQTGARCPAFAPHPAVSHRDARACGARRHGRTSDRAVGSGPARRLAAGPARDRHEPRHARVHVRARRLGVDRPARRAGADSRVEQGRARPGRRGSASAALAARAAALTVHDVIVTCQIAVSLVMLIGAALFVQSLRNLSSVEPGFRADDLLLISVDPGSAGYDAQRRRAFLARHARSREPGPWGPERVAGQDRAAGAGPPEAAGVQRAVGRSASRSTPMSSVLGYFHTLGIPLLRGREFDERGRKDVEASRDRQRTHGPDVLAGPGPDRQGAANRSVPAARHAEVVGVVKDVKYRDLRDDAGPMLYLPVFQTALDRPDDVARSRRERPRCARGHHPSRDAERSTRTFRSSGSGRSRISWADSSHKHARRRSSPVDSAFWRCC